MRSSPPCQLQVHTADADAAVMQLSRGTFAVLYNRCGAPCTCPYNACCSSSCPALPLVSARRPSLSVAVGRVIIAGSIPPVSGRLVSVDCGFYADKNNYCGTHKTLCGSIIVLRSGPFRSGRAESAEVRRIVISCTVLCVCLAVPPLMRYTN